MSTVPTNTPRARRIRRYTAGASLIGFPLLLVPQALLDPVTGSFQDAAATDPGGLLICGLLLLGSALLTFPAIGAILHEARDRGALVTDIGAFFTGLGALGHAALGVMYLLLRSLAGGEPAAMVAFEERLNADAGLGVVALVLLLSFGVGITLLAWGAWRAGLIGWWGPAVVTTVVLAHNLLPVELPSAADALALGLVTLVYGRLGVGVIGRSDREWESTGETLAVGAGRVDVAM